MQIRRQLPMGALRMTEIKTVSVYDLLPPNLQAEPEVANAAKSIDAESHSLADAITKLTYFNRLDSLTSEETDELAWQWHVDFYGPTLPLSQRRQLVKNSYRWHRKKGVPVAVEELLSTIFDDARVEEWWEYEGDPYHFRVKTTNPNATASQAQEFIRAVDAVKNVRSWFDGVLIDLYDEGEIYFGAALQEGEFMVLDELGVPTRNETIFLMPWQPTEGGNGV